MSRKEPLTEVHELRRCVRDLVALSALPAIWTDFDPRQIAESVASALVSMLDLEFVCVSLSGHDDEAPVEVVSLQAPGDGQDTKLKTALGDWLSNRRVARTGTMDNPIGPGLVAICSIPIGVAGEAVIVAASRQFDFPTDAQRLLVGIGANEAATAIGRWRAEAAERRLLALADSSLDFIGIATLDGRPIYLNPAALRIVGLRSLEDAARRHLLDFVMSEEQARMRDVLWPQVLKEGRWIGEISFRHFVTGAAILFLVDWFRIDDPRTGRPMNISTVSRDLTEQKRYEARLRRLNETLEQRVAERTAELAETNRNLIRESRDRELADARLQEVRQDLFHAARLSAAGQMAAALAHELNQPLTAAANSVAAARRFLAQDGEGIVTASEVMGEANEQIFRAGQIIRRLREFVSRGESDKREELVSTMVEEACALALKGQEGLGVQVRLHFESSTRHVLVNRIQIQQVLVNLMRNAIEAMDADGRRELDLVTSLPDERMVEIALTDTGPGLDDDIAARLFEPFVSSKANGMGLGLSICRSIVEVHGGRIQCEANPGGGMTFRFTVPSAPHNGDNNDR